MANSFFGKKNQGNNAVAINQKEQERLMKERQTDFEKRAKEFWPEFFALTRKHGCDIGIIWNFDPMHGPKPNTTVVDIKNLVDKERSEAAGIVKPNEGGIIKKDTPIA